MDRQIEHWGPDIVSMEENASKCLTNDVACPIHNILILERNEKMDNYPELRLEKARMVNKEIFMVPINIGALRSIPNDLDPT